MENNNSNSETDLEYVFRLEEFKFYDDKDDPDTDSGEEGYSFGDKSTFTLQLFGINEEGKTASIIAREFRPFFFAKVPNYWKKTHVEQFIGHLRQKVGKYYQGSILDGKLIERKKLYSFDAGKKHRFVYITFANTAAFNKTKNLWYTGYEKNEEGQSERTLLPGGYTFNDEKIELYEGNIPPLLRFFHIRDISPSGWVSLPAIRTTKLSGRTSCDFEFSINYKHIIRD